MSVCESHTHTITYTLTQSRTRSHAITHTITHMITHNLPYDHAQSHCRFLTSTTMMGPLSTADIDTLYLLSVVLTHILSGVHLLYCSTSALGNLNWFSMPLVQSTAWWDPEPALLNWGGECCCGVCVVRVCGAGRLVDCLCCFTYLLALGHK